MAIAEQCRFLEINWAHYTAKGESEPNIQIMRRLDELLLENPLWGSRKIRKILSWEIINYDGQRLLLSTQELVLRVNGDPGIFNTDQACQFTSPAFTGILEEKDIRISMDSKGRALDNIIMEQFWRTIKYDEVYLKDYEDFTECRSATDSFISRYNGFRPHQSLNGQTPDSVYAAGLRSIVMDDQANFVKKASRSPHD